MRLTLKARPALESSGRDFRGDGYNEVGPQVKSTFHQLSHSRHGEPVLQQQQHEARGEEGNPLSGRQSAASAIVREQGDVVDPFPVSSNPVQSTFQQPVPPVGGEGPCNYEGPEIINLLSDSDDDDEQIQVLRSIAGAQNPAFDDDEVELIEVRQAGASPPFYLHCGGIDESAGNETTEFTTQLAAAAADGGVTRTRGPCAGGEGGYQIIEPTFKEADCERERGPNPLPTPQQHIRNGGEEHVQPSKSVERTPTGAVGNTKLQGPSEEFHFETHSFTPPPDALYADVFYGVGDQSLEEDTGRDHEMSTADGETGEHELVYTADGIQFVQRSNQWMYPNVCAATDDENLVRTTAHMEGSQPLVQTHEDTLMANSAQPDDLRLGNAMVSSHCQEQMDNAHSPAHLAQWQAAQKSYHSLVSLQSLQNGSYNAQNPSRETSSSYATQQMAVNHDGSGSLPAARFIVTTMSSAKAETFSQYASAEALFTPVDTRDSYSYAQPGIVGSSLAAQIPSHDHNQWAGYSQTRDGTGVSAQPVSRMTSPQLPLAPVKSQENWQYNNPTETDLATEFENAPIAWGWANESIPTRIEENLLPEDMPTETGVICNSTPQPMEPWNFAGESRQREKLHHDRSAGDVEQELRREEQQRREVEIPMSYHGADETQRQCTWEEHEARKGKGSTVVSAGGYEEDYQQNECDCEDCQSQFKGTGTDNMISEDGDGHVKQDTQEEQWQSQMGVGMGPQGVGEYHQQQQQVSERWLDLGGGTIMKVLDEDVQELLRQSQEFQMGNEDDQQMMNDDYDHGSRNAEPEGVGTGDHEYYDNVHSKSEEMHDPGDPDIWDDDHPVEQEQDEEEELQHAESEDFDSASCLDETSSRWQEGHARLKHKLVLWTKARFRARVVTHPIFPHLIQAHVDCLRLMTPASKLDEVNQQLANLQPIYAKYLPFAPHHPQADNKRLDLVLKKLMVDMDNYRTGLDNNIRIQATPTYAHLWRTERTLFQLTGTRIPDQLESDDGPTMSDESEDEGPELLEGDGHDSDAEIAEGAETAEGGSDGLHHENENDSAVEIENDGPTAADRAAMETIRKELIDHLGLETYRKQIKVVRDEIMRKRRAGKLPDGTTDVLKEWWEAHSKWPYPTEEEKDQLIRATGLELKQVNNWFINQRKRNWQSNPLGQKDRRN